METFTRTFAVQHGETWQEASWRAARQLSEWGFYPYGMTHTEKTVTFKGTYDEESDSNTNS